MTHRMCGVFLVAALTGCGGWKRTGTSPKADVGDRSPATVELSIANLTQEQAQQLVQQIDEYWEVENVKLRSYADRVAVYDLDLRDGCECEFPAMMARIPTPGFKYQGRRASFRYAAFDNIAPKVAFVKPTGGAILRDRQLETTVEVTDPDVSEVTLNGQPMLRNGTRFTAIIPLREGANDLLAIARDATGNEGRDQIRVGLDSTPPDVTASITVIIEGDVDPGSRVYIDGNEVKVDNLGHYQARVRAKRGQREVEVVAIDPLGNRTQTLRPLGD